MMDFEAALEVRQEIATFLRVGGIRRRGRRTRVAIGVAPSPDGMRIAIRARSTRDLERAFGAGAGDTVTRMASAELDIVITGQVAAAPPINAASPGRLRLGASVGHYNATAGTLGFFATDPRGDVGFVSNNHVLAECDHGEEGDAILHPGRIDGGVRPKDVVATLSRTYPRLRSNRPVVDAAFARLEGSPSYDPSRITDHLRLVPGVPPLHLQREVLKVGRSTGVTRGVISAFALQNLDVDYPIGTVFLDRQIEIRSLEQPFSKAGDSGSLIVNPDGHPVALLFAGASESGLSYANPIEDVLHDLGVTFLL